MRKAILILAGITLLGSTLGITGCATTPYNRLGYKFIGRNEDSKLVRRNNDLYIEKINGSDSRRITNTPETCEDLACFSKNGEYILYAHYIITYIPLKSNYYIYYYQPTDGDDSQRTEVDASEFYSLKAK